jgi:hypothetical protein
MEFSKSPNKMRLSSFFLISTLLLELYIFAYPLYESGGVFLSFGWTTAWWAYIAVNVGSIFALVLFRFTRLTCTFGVVALSIGILIFGVLSYVSSPSD